MMTTYDSSRFNGLITPRLLHMIAGSKAKRKDYNDDVLKLTEEAEDLFEIERKTHAELYDDYHGALPKLVSFFEGYLTKLCK